MLDSFCSRLVADSSSSGSMADEFTSLPRYPLAGTLLAMSSDDPVPLLDAGGRRWRFGKFVDRDEHSYTAPGRLVMS